MKRPVFWARDAVDDIKRQVSFIAAENATAAITLSEKLRETGEALGIMAIGRPGRVPGTFEKSLVGLPYILAYAVQQAPSENDAGKERIVILRVIHTAREWPAGTWPKTT